MKKIICLVTPRNLSLNSLKKHDIIIEYIFIILLYQFKDLCNLHSIFYEILNDNTFNVFICNTSNLNSIKKINCICNEISNE